MSYRSSHTKEFKNQNPHISSQENAQKDVEVLKWIGHMVVNAILNIRYSLLDVREVNLAGSNSD